MEYHINLLRCLRWINRLLRLNGVLTHKRKEQPIQHPQLLGLPKNRILPQLYSSSPCSYLRICLRRKYDWSNGVHHAPLTQNYVGEYETTQTYLSIEKKSMTSFFYFVKQLISVIRTTRFIFNKYFKWISNI